MNTERKFKEIRLHTTKPQTDTLRKLGFPCPKGYPFDELDPEIEQLLSVKIQILKNKAMNINELSQTILENLFTDQMTMADYKAASAFMQNALTNIIKLPSAKLITEEEAPSGRKFKYQRVVVYTDGACSGNPGPGGLGLVIEKHTSRCRHMEFHSEGYVHTTNNRMELRAAILALHKHLDITKEKEIITDSRYVTDAVNKGWLESWKKKDFKGVANEDLWREFSTYMDDIRKAGRKVTFTWVKGHAGNTWNERCDAMAVEASKNPKLIDEGYENQNQ